MYRHLLLVILIGFSLQSGNSSRCNNQKPTWPWFMNPSLRERIANDRTAAKIAQDVIKSEMQIRSFCQSHAEHYMKETYGMDKYKLSLSVEDFDERSILVKVVHNMVYVTADDCRSTYADIRLLPDIVDPTKGKWRYALGELTIYFPYFEIPTVEMETNCGPYISTGVIVVPKCAEEEEIEPDIDVRFGDTELKSTIKDSLVRKEE